MDTVIKAHTHIIIKEAMAADFNVLDMVSRPLKGEPHSIWILLCFTPRSLLAMVTCSLQSDPMLVSGVVRSRPQGDK